MNYRELYKKYYGCDLASNMDIHHIDGNHENNDIKNLLALPRKLHSEYHIILNKFNCDKTTININVVLNSSLAISYKVDLLKDLVKVLEEIKGYLAAQQLNYLERNKKEWQRNFTGLN